MAINMRNPKLLMRHAFILDVLCLLLCSALLILGTNGVLKTWLMAVGAFIAFVALAASIFLFIKARKIDRAEARRIESEILKNAAREEAVNKAIEDGDIADDQEEDYKTDDE